MAPYFAIDLKLAQEQGETDDKECVTLMTKKKEQGGAPDKDKTIR